MRKFSIFGNLLFYFQMYGKYGRAVKKKVEDDDPTFGFATPKKNAMIDRTNLVLSATKKTPVSKAMERGTPKKRASEEATIRRTNRTIFLSIMVLHRRTVMRLFASSNLLWLL